MRAWTDRFLLALAILTLVAAGLALALPHLTPTLITWQLDRMGLEGAIEQADIGRARAVLRGIRIGQSQSVARLQLDYRPLDLMRGRIGVVRAEGVRLQARLGPDGLDLPGLPRGEGDGSGLVAPLPERIMLEDVVVSVATPAGDLRLAGGLAAEVEGTLARFELAIAGLELAIAGLEATGPSGSASGTGKLTGRIDVAADDLLASLEAAGALTYELQGLALPTQDLVLAGAGGIELGAQEGRLRLTTKNSDLVLDGTTTAAAAAGASLPARLRLGGDEEAFELVLQVAGPAPKLTAAGPLTFEAGAVSARGQARAVAELDANSAGPVVRAAALQLHASGLGLDQLEITGATLDVTGHGTPAAASASGRLEAQARGVLPGGLRAGQATLALPFAATIDRGAAALTLPEAGRLTASGLMVPELVEEGRLDLQIGPAADPLLRLDLASTEWQAALPLAVQDAHAQLADALRLEVLAAERGQIRLEAEGRGETLAGGRLLVADAVLASTQPPVRLEGTSLEAPFGPAGLVPGTSAPLAIQTIRAAGGAVPPLTLAGRLRPGQDAIAFTATLQDTGRRVTLRLDGRHNFARGRGAATVELAPVQFAPERLQPGALVPALADTLEQVSGRVALDGEIGWGEAGLASDLELLLDRLAFTAGAARVEGLAGVITIDNLVPPSTPPDQRLAIGLLDLGLVLVDGRSTFRLEPGGPLVVDDLRFQWAGGELEARPFTIGSDLMSFSTTLQARKLDLNAIFEEVRLPGLSGEGTIDGALPVRVQGGEAVIEGGELRARQPGWIRYRPEQTPDAFAAGGESMGLLLQALENFRYDELRLTLDGRTDAAMDIGLHLKGANPDLYDGHPIEFNLDLEGELANILRSGLRSYTLPDRVRERIERFGRR